jgi:hypothetical protein
MKNILKAAVLCLALYSPAAALEITAVSTDPVKGAVKADFTFSAFTVKNISYDKGAVVLPVTENKGKTFTDIKLLSKGLYAKLDGCFKNGCAKPAKAPAAPKVKIEGFKPLKSKARVANAEISFDGELLVVAGVMVSNKEPGAFWVAFPYDLVFADGAFKSAVESAVIAAWVKKSK